ncbi:MAG: hypothetical protein Unbinned2026contig1000_17 [Prokaryotic dsDNA virus sp.]|nr:MAG: hypothetical protein Unbinned2026contig1000_17 [Prokaryotic dsDNA virus sp.]|tara:strand:- start:3756 stop:4169 length:414 start_codon:yes stop_codon:yes gene_type:complete
MIMRKRKALKHNKTIFALRRGIINMTKRITIPCVHLDQIKLAVRVLRELADDMERICGQNEPSSVDKLSNCQSHIMLAHHRLMRQWSDPRGRHGYIGEQLERDSWGLRDVKGHDELQERLEKEDEGRTLNDKERFTG